jgi:hypothetical protein
LIPETTGLLVNIKSKEQLHAKQKLLIHFRICK